MRRSEGFTLVELLIVLAVIAALLATVTPVALNAVKKAKATQVAENLRNIKTATEQFVYTEQPDLPASGGASISTLTIDDLHVKGYLSKKPENYELEVSTWTSEGTAYATVIYNANDVDADMVHKTYSEATNAGGKLHVSFELAKYW